MTVSLSLLIKLANQSDQGGETANLPKEVIEKKDLHSIVLFKQLEVLFIYCLNFFPLNKPLLLFKNDERLFIRTGFKIVNQQ